MIHKTKQNVCRHYALTFGSQDYQASCSVESLCRPVDGISQIFVALREDRGHLRIENFASFRKESGLLDRADPWASDLHSPQTDSRKNNRQLLSLAIVGCFWLLLAAVRALLAHSRFHAVVPARDPTGCSVCL